MIAVLFARSLSWANLHFPVVAQSTGRESVCLTAAWEARAKIGDPCKYPGSSWHLRIARLRRAYYYFFRWFLQICTSALWKIYLARWRAQVHWRGICAGKVLVPDDHSWNGSGQAVAGGDAVGKGSGAPDSRQTASKHPSIRVWRGNDKQLSLAFVVSLSYRQSRSQCQSAGTVAG